MTGLTATASELASAFATALAAGDADAAVARCADDVAMVMMYPPPGADGVIRGRDAVREMFARPQRAMAGFAGTTPVVHDVVGGRLVSEDLLRGAVACLQLAGKSVHETSFFSTVQQSDGS